MRGLIATPKLRDGRVFGVEVRPAAGSDVMARAGLVDGDVLLTINGEGVGAMSPAQMATRIGAERRAELVFDRGGRSRTVIIEFNE